MGLMTSVNRVDMERIGSRQFRKRPVVIEAVRYMGPGSLDEIKGFIGNTPNADGRSAGFEGDELKIYTLEGTMTVSLGDWIIRGMKGEFYPCKPDIFAATYESVGAALIEDVVSRS